MLKHANALCARETTWAEIALLSSKGRFAPMLTSSAVGLLRRSPSRPHLSLFALLCAIALLGGLLLLATVASGATSMRAGAPGTWSLLGSGMRTVSGQIGTARTSDGVLHVIWSRGGAGTPYALFETAVTPAGKVSPAQTIVSGWSRIDDVDATVTKGEPLTIGFTGTKTDKTGDPTNGLTLATKNGSWTVGAAAVYSTDLVGSSVPAIGYSTRGQPIQAWSAGGKLTVHVGIDPAQPARSFGEVGGNVVLTQQVAIGTTPNPANDSTGIGWCGDAGIFWGVAAVTPDPKIGLRGQVLPGSSTTRCPAAARTNLILGHDGGFFAAASVAAERKVLVWHIGDQPMTAAAGTGIKQQIALGSDPVSRLWIAWRDTNSNRLLLRRSNRSANGWGAVVSTKLPPSQDSLYQLTIDGQKDRADVIARTTKGSAVSLFHTQMWPGLSVEASNKAGLVTVSVTDAGEAVPGVTVRIGGHSLRANERGQASLKLQAGTYRVAASKTKYVSANTSVRVKTVPPNGRP
jgi:hypothetical protein